MGHVAHMRTKQTACSDLVVKLKEEDSLEDIDMGILLQSVLILG